MKKEIVELFAGVGGFRLGFELADSNWKTVFANQWEPGKKNQFAFDCYKKHFEDKGGITEYSNSDIATVSTKDIPNHTVLVGGFPCQDYSVASTGASGIQGKKGVLWWEIKRIIEDKKPKFILLENVDRLLKSPSSQRGRDFGVMLACLNELGYGVEWRVINAAEYGFVQRRKRIFIFAFYKDTKYFKEIEKQSFEDIILKQGIFAKKFKVVLDKEKKGTNKTIDISNNLQEISDNFKFTFENAGVMLNNQIYTTKVESQNTSKNEKTLESILESNVDPKYYIKEEELEKWQYLKGTKAISRKSKEGFEYIYREGAIAFPDPLDKPARTMLTSEATKNRSTHIIEDSETKRLRKLTPLECERINGFLDNWTDTNMTDTNRYFCMGNALVVGIITELAKEIGKIVEEE